LRPAYALVACFVLVGPVAAQPGVMLGEVTAESVALRAGPTDQFPEAGMLFRGAKVYVAHDEGEQWYAVEPPPGQLSWIRSVHLEPIGGEEATRQSRWNAWVRAESTAELSYGRPGFDKPLDVRRTKLPEATIVAVVGTKVTHNGVGWYPIAAPYGDYRYVPKSAVKVVRHVPAQTFVVKSPQTEPSDTRPTVEPVAASIPNKPGAGSSPSHPLWAQAERAERDSDFTQAESLYLKLAAEMNQPGGDVSVANVCYTRIHSVREKRRQMERGGTTPADPVKRDTPGGEKWVGPGVLRPAGFRLDNKPTYALVGSQGQVRCYAVAGPNVDLERFRGFDVELFGTLTHPSDLRGVGALTASRVQTVK
jgi:hypothetical protein